MSSSPLVLRAGELAAAVHGQLASGRPDVLVAGLSIDSRRVSPGDLFVAIRGERFDGHAFVADAVKKGASGVIVSDTSVTSASEVPSFVIVVDDTTRALQYMARHVRRLSGARVVAITGSIGKTTTKEISATLLASKYRVFRNHGNLNNHIGLPLSLFALRDRPEIAVVELGMNHAGEIRVLVETAEPDTCVWTNVTEVHSAFFESLDTIADAKAEILEIATAKTDLIANAADPRIMTRISQFPGSVTTFGIDVAADVSASNVRGFGLDGMEATVRTPDDTGSLRTPLLGRGNVANILAAIAVALRFQIPLEAMLSAIATLQPQARRGEVLRLGNVTVVDDSYNSNPTSLSQALETVGWETRYRRRVAVLGEMLELGLGSNARHTACGRAASKAGFELVVTVGGPAAIALAEGAIAAGLSTSAVITCRSSEEAAAVVLKHVQAGDLVLVKGSRGIRMEVVVDRLKADLA